MLRLRRVFQPSGKVVKGYRGKGDRFGLWPIRCDGILELVQVL